MTSLLFLILVFACFAGVDYLLWRSGWRDIQRRFRSSERIGGPRVWCLSARAGSVGYQGNMHAAVGNSGIRFWFCAPFGWGFHKAVVVPWAKLAVVASDQDKTELRLGDSPLTVYGPRFAAVLKQFAASHGDPVARDNHPLQRTGPAERSL